MRWACALLVCACVSLDRRDGALELIIENPPSDTAQIEVSVEVTAPDGEVREFELIASLPEDRIIKDFSAVPVGKAEVRLKLLDAMGIVLEETEPMRAEIEEGTTSRVVFSFFRPAQRGRPSITILSPEDGGAHLVDRGVIDLEFEVRNPQTAPTAVRRVTATARGASIDISEPSLEFIGVVEPIDGEAELPSLLTISVEACLVDIQDSCAREDVTVEVHRRLWQWPLDDSVVGAPLVFDDVAVVLERSGEVSMRSLDTGMQMGSSVTIAGPITRPKMVAARLGAGPDLALIVDAQDNLHALLPSDGLSTAWVQSFAGFDAAPTAPYFDGSALYLGAGTQLFRLALNDGTPTEVLSMPGELSSAPLSDALGLVVVDKSGNVVAREPSDEGGGALYSLKLPGRVRASPVRFGEEAAIITTSGELFLINPMGESRQVASLLAAAIYPPVVVGESLVFIGADRVGRYHPQLGSEARSLGVSEVITGPPAVWSSEGEVVLSTSTGRVYLVDAQNFVSISKFDAAAMAPVVLPGRRILVGTLDERLTMLKIEEGFDEL